MYHNNELLSNNPIDLGMIHARDLLSLCCENIFKLCMLEIGIRI